MLAKLPNMKNRKTNYKNIIFFSLVALGFAITFSLKQIVILEQIKAR